MMVMVVVVLLLMLMMSGAGTMAVRQLMLRRRCPRNNLLLTVYSWTLFHSRLLLHQLPRLQQILRY